MATVEARFSVGRGDRLELDPKQREAREAGIHLTRMGVNARKFVGVKLGKEGNAR